MGAEMGDGMVATDVGTCHPALLPLPLDNTAHSGWCWPLQSQGGGTGGIYPNSFSWSSLVAAPCPRNVDRPELCQVSLYDFQKFLLHDQKVGFPRERWSHGMLQPSSPSNNSHVYIPGILGQRRGHGAGLHVLLPQGELQRGLRSLLPAG